MFSRLEEITLSGFRTLSPISWHTLPGMFCQAFQHLLRVQSLKDVSILYVSCFPLSLLDKTLRVTLYNCRNAQYDEGSIEVQPLERLSIQQIWTLEKVTSWVQMRSLRSLRVSLDQFEFREFLPPLLSTCSSTLINLDLDIGQARTFSSVESHFPKLTIQTSPKFVRNLSGVWSRISIHWQQNGPSISIHTCSTWNNLQSSRFAPCGLEGMVGISTLPRQLSQTSSRLRHPHWNKYFLNSPCCSRTFPTPTPPGPHLFLSWRNVRPSPSRSLSVQSLKSRMSGTNIYVPPRFFHHFLVVVDWNNMWRRVYSFWYRKLSR